MSSTVKIKLFNLAPFNFLTESLQCFCRNCILSIVVQCSSRVVFAFQYLLNTTISSCLASPISICICNSKNCFKLLYFIGEMMRYLFLSSTFNASYDVHLKIHILEIFLSIFDDCTLLNSNACQSIVWFCNNLKYLKHQFEYLNCFFSSWQIKER